MRRHPTQSLPQALARQSARRLYVPLVSFDRVQLQRFRQLRNRHGVGQVLLVSRVQGLSKAEMYDASAG